MIFVDTIVASARAPEQLLILAGHRSVNSNLKIRWFIDKKFRFSSSSLNKKTSGISAGGFSGNGIDDYSFAFTIG